MVKLLLRQPVGIEWSRVSNKIASTGRDKRRLNNVVFLFGYRGKVRSGIG